MWLLLRETVRQFEQRGQTLVDVSELDPEVWARYELTEEHCDELV